MRQNRPIRIACRLAWAGLFVAHAYWFVKAIASTESTTSSPLLLALALAFFFLKVLDVHTLRVRWSRRSLLCALLVVVLLHTQVFDQALLDGSDLVWLALPTQFVSLIALRLLALVGAALLLWAGMSEQRRQTSLAARAYSTVSSSATSLRRRIHVLATTPLRGPPHPGENFA